MATASSIVIVRRDRRRRRRMRQERAIEDAEFARRNRAMEMQEPIAFFITHKKSGKVLTIKNAKNEPGARVVISDTESLSDGRFHQLWFPDETGIIRSKMNGYALEVSDHKSLIIASAYQKDRINQQWTFTDHEGFQNQHMLGLHIVEKPGCSLFHRDVIACVTGPEYTSPWIITRIV